MFIKATDRGAGCLSLDGHAKAAAHTDGMCAVRFVGHLPISSLSSDRFAESRQPGTDTGDRPRTSSAAVLHKMQSGTSSAVVLHEMQRQRLRVCVCLRARTTGCRATSVNGAQRGTVAGTGAWMATNRGDTDRPIVAYNRELGPPQSMVHSGGTAAGTGAWMATKRDPDDDSDQAGPHQYAD